MDTLSHAVAFFREDGSITAVIILIISSVFSSVTVPDGLESGFMREWKSGERWEY
jgi:hypothetical protein